MAEPVSDFMDFGAWQKLAAQSEEEALQRELESLSQADAQASSALALAGHDAERQVANLSQVGSYGDYLKAKQTADKARAAVNARLSGGSVIQGDARAQARAAQAAGPQALANREAKIEGDRVAQNASILRQREERTAQEAAAKKAADEREARVQDAQRRYLESLVGGAKARAAAGGAQRDYVGGYNPYASSAWAQQQGAFEAQQARNAGADMNQQHSIWDAYTGKGSMGAGAAPGKNVRDRYANMEEAMNPYAPRKPRP